MSTTAPRELVDTAALEPLRELEGADGTLLDEVLQLFEEASPNDRAALSVALAAGDAPAAARAAHRWKGACRSVGAIALAAELDAIESLSRQGALAGLAERAVALGPLYAETLTALFRLRPA